MPEGSQQQETLTWLTGANENMQHPSNLEHASGGRACHDYAKPTYSNNITDLLSSASICPSSTCTRLAPASMHPFACIRGRRSLHASCVMAYAGADGSPPRCPATGIVQRSTFARPDGLAIALSVAYEAGQPAHQSGDLHAMTTDAQDHLVCKAGRRAEGMINVTG